MKPARCSMTLIKANTLNRNGLSSLALRSIIHNKCPQVLEQKSLRETHMQINAREIFHIFFRYLLCGGGCVFPSWRQRSVRGTGECKINRGYMIFKSALLDSNHTVYAHTHVLVCIVCTNVCIRCNSIHNVAPLPACRSDT